MAVSEQKVKQFLQHAEKYLETLTALPEEEEEEESSIDSDLSSLDPAEVECLIEDNVPPPPRPPKKVPDPLRERNLVVNKTPKSGK